MSQGFIVLCGTVTVMGKRAAYRQTRCLLVPSLNIKKVITSYYASFCKITLNVKMLKKFKTIPRCTCFNNHLRLELNLL